MSSTSDPSRLPNRIQAPIDESSLSFARWLLREKQFQQAIQTCRAALKISEPSAELHETLGRALLLSGDSESSLWHFLQATVLAPIQATGFTNLGAAYNQLQRFEPAVDVLMKAVAIKPSATAYYNLGFAHRHLNNLPYAKAAYREALRLDPNSADALRCSRVGFRVDAIVDGADQHSAGSAGSARSLAGEVERGGHAD